MTWDEWVTVREATEGVERPRQTIHTWIRNDVIRSAWRGDTLLVHASDVMEAHNLKQSRGRVSWKGTAGLDTVRGKSTLPENVKAPAARQRPGAGSTGWSRT